MDEDIGCDEFGVSHPMTVPNRVEQLQREVEQLKKAMGDAYIEYTQSMMAAIRALLAADDPHPESLTDIDRVVDALDRRIVSDPDRMRLRKAVDRADAPLTGRAGADEGLRGAIGRMK